jgi:hypothetical protein
MKVHCIIRLEVDFMIYGIVSDKDSEATRTVFRSKKIEDTNIYSVNKLDILASRLNNGDNIICISVNRFMSVSHYVAFSEKVLNAGASLQCLEQPYLTIGNGRHWKSSVITHLTAMTRAEGVTANRLHSAFVLTDKGKFYVDRCVTDMSIELLARTFAVDGILRRVN